MRVSRLSLAPPVVFTQTLAASSEDMVNVSCYSAVIAAVGFCTDQSSVPWEHSSPHVCLGPLSLSRM